MSTRITKEKVNKEIVVLAFHDNQSSEMRILRKVLNHRSCHIQYRVKEAALDEDLYWSLKNEELPDIVLINMDGSDPPDGRIFSIIREVRRIYSKGVIITGAYNDDAQIIVESLECGADDYISKQVRLRNFPLDLYNIYQRSIERQKKMGEKLSNSHQVVGRTMKDIDATIPHIIDSAIVSVFIYGESGTGKEAVADLFRYHANSRSPFIKVNCGAISPSLIEAEFFGYVKGAFTGATFDKIGLIERASGGWLFLDEITALSKSAQAALLRAIENQEIIRVGDNSPKQVCVKFISATNEDIVDLVDKGKFRLDLWQRLTDKTIFLPTLRDRPDEIEAIIRHHCQTMRGGPYTITDPTIGILTQLPWKAGNIRQLRNCLRAMTECHADKVLTPITIPKHIRDEIPQQNHCSIGIQISKEFGFDLTPQTDTLPSFDDLADRLLVQLIDKSLKVTPQVNSLRKLAKQVGMVRTTLSNRLRKIAQKPLGKERNVQEILKQFLDESSLSH